MNKAGAGDPREVQKVDLSSQNLNKIICEDLVLFDHLHTLDVAENSLSLIPLGYLPALKDLVVASNKITELQADVAFGLPLLERLDISFNSLSQESIATLAALPHLRSLILSHNHLRELPNVLTNMGTWWKQFEDGEEESHVPESIGSLPGFLKLNTLDLSYNRFSDFSNLAETLKSLPE